MKDNVSELNYNVKHYTQYLLGTKKSPCLNNGTFYSFSAF